MFYVLLGIVLGILIYLKVIKPAQYWEDKDVPHIPAWPLIGNMGKFILRKEHFMDSVVNLYRNFPHERYVGFMNFSRPSLVIRDLNLIKQITIKEFDHFQDHATVVQSEFDEILAKNLISLKGEDWKRMRATLSPVFTSSKMRSIYVLMTECAQNFVGHFQKSTSPSTNEMKELFSRFANDVIATTAFGIQVDSLSEPKNDFFTMGQALTEFSVVQAFKLIAVLLSSKLTELLKIRFIPKNITDYFEKIINDNIMERRNKGIVRPDLVNLLMQVQKGKLKHDTIKDKQEGFAAVEESSIGKTTSGVVLNEKDIAAQALLFFFAGFDTVSTASSFLAYELAINPEVQRRLQREIDQVSFDGVISYEDLLSLKYLDQVVSEALRLWPPSFHTDRLCVKDFKIEPEQYYEKPFNIAKGIPVIIPIMAIHRDPKYYPEPEKFNPERFSEENKSKIVPGTYMPFGVGPRNCIGSRFALLEIKTLFFNLLQKFDIVPTDKTDIPLKLSLKKPNLTPENGLWLAFRARRPD